MTKALVLLSGGQDSTTALFWAKHRLATVVEVHALTVHYGQRHYRELLAADEVAKVAGVASHKVIDLSAVMEGGSSDLLASHANRKIKDDGGMADRTMPQGLPTSFVPGRNLMFLAVAAARAGAIGAQHIVTGLCQTDYSGYPDCRGTFVIAMQEAIKQAWPSGEPCPRVHVPLLNMTKADTVKLARELGDCWRALRVSVTCYYGKHPGCGDCPSCRIRAKGFDEAGEIDPAQIGYGV